MLLVGFLYACGGGGEEKQRRVINRPSLGQSGPGIKVEVENKGTVVYGDTIYMQVSSAKEGEQITGVTVEIVNGNRRVAESTDGNIQIATLKSGGGNLRFKITADFASGEKSNRYKNVKIVAPEAPGNWDFEVVARYPHSPHAYTQGLLVHNGFIYEGTGTYGGSKIMKSDLVTGNILKEKHLSADYFGEGITIFDNKLYQLTYKSGKVFVYDLESFERIDEFTYHFHTSEGWGLTHNDTSLIASDGSASLYFIDPSDFSIRNRIEVFDENGSVLNVNELEYRDGVIYANIYTTARIVAIDAETGMVLDNYTARGIVMQSETTQDMDVLNGIAINPLNGNLLITGKNWSIVYEVRPIPSAV